MFLFYMAMLADITPPVALSAFAASAVFGLDPIKTGVKAAAVAIPKYLYTISFVYSYWGASLLIVPVLLHSTAPQAALLIASRVAASLAGIWFLMIANVGYYRSYVPTPLRILIGASGVAMMIPSEVINMGAFIVGMASTAISAKLAKRLAEAPPPSP